METIKKTFKQILTTGATTDQRAGYFLIIPDTGVTYSMKLLLTSDVTDIGFLDPVDSISDDTIYYDILYDDYRCVKINQSDTTIYDIIYGDYVCSMVDAESTLTVDIKYLCPTGSTNGLAGIYDINSSTHSITEYEIEHIKTLIVNNGVVTFNMFNVEFIVNDVLRPHYQRYSINNGIWIDNTNNPNTLTFNLSGDTILNVELYNDVCVPTTTIL